MDVNRTIAVWHATTPHPAIDVLPRDHAVRPVGHGDKHFELANCQRSAGSVDERLAVVKPKLERPKDDLMTFGGLCGYCNGIHALEATRAKAPSRERPVTQW